MARRTCESRPSGNDRPGRRHLAIPLAALLFQAVPPALLWAVASASFAQAHPLPEAWVQPLSLLTLAFAAGASGSLGTFGVYGLLTRARPAVALAMILLCCVPAILAGAVYLHAWLVFMAWV